MSPVDGVPVAPSAPEPVNYQPLPGTTQTAYMTPPGAYPQQQVVYPPGTQTVIMAQPAPVYVQQMQRPAGYNDGLCSCGHDLGPAHWTIVAWVLCLCFCPFNFCYPACMPETRRCMTCSKVYYKP